MKTTITILLAGMFVLLPVLPALAMDERHGEAHERNHIGGNRSVDIDDDGTLRLEHEGRRLEWIEITADYRLSINGRPIETDDEADRLLEHYYEQTIALVAEAKKIGLKAGEIGLRGGELGVNAAAGVLRAFLTEYEMEDLERDLEDASEKLEDDAADLETEAEGLEETADELNEIAEDLSYEVPELRKMKWFYD
jgi:cell division protein ZapA (FtsZ GTPase activity inhibitor)